MRKMRLGHVVATSVGMALLASGASSEPAVAPGVDVEIVAARQPSSRRFLRPDGSARSEVVLGALHYADDRGALQPISTELHVGMDGSFVNDANSLVSRFPATADGIVSVRSRQHEVALSWRSAGLAVALADGSHAAAIPPRGIAAALEGSSVLVQQGAYPGITERYRVAPGAVEHELALDESATGGCVGPDMTLHVAWDVRVTSGRIAPAKDAGFLVEDESGRACYSLPPPFVVACPPDADCTRPLVYRMEPRGVAARLVLEVPAAMLAGATPLEPLVIDPSVVDLYLGEQDVIAYGPRTGANLTVDSGLVFCDVDGDGADDLVMGDGRNRVSVFVGPRPTGTAFDLLTDVPDVTLDGGRERVHFGFTFAVADLSADGREDLIVGARAERGLRGQVLVYFTPIARGTMVTDALAEADVRIVGVSEADLFGARVVADDFDDDGHADLLIGAPRARHAVTDTIVGEAYILFGPFAIGTVRDLATTPADVVIRPSSHGFRDDLGEELASADLSADGVPDVVLGTSPDSCEGVSPSTPCRTVQVLVGRPRASWPSVLDLEIDPPEITLRDAEFGTSQTVVATGEVSGDSKPDLLVGDAHYNLPGRARAGRVQIFFGPLPFGMFADMDALVDAVIWGADEIDSTPTEIDVGDIDGDGQGDVVLGVEAGQGLDNRGGALRIGEVDCLLGPVTPGLVDLRRHVPDLYITGRGGSGLGGISHFGHVVALGDYSGDGIDDVGAGCVGAKGPGDTRSSCGEAYVIFPDVAPCVPPGEMSDLRIRKYLGLQGRAILSFMGNPLPHRGDAGVFRGSLASLHDSGLYDHGGTWCGLTEGFVELSLASEPASYYLAVGVTRGSMGACEGPYGDARIGDIHFPRPSASALGTTTCP